MWTLEAAELACDQALADYDFSGCDEVVMASGWHHGDDESMCVLCMEGANGRYDRRFTVLFNENTTVVCGVFLGDPC